MIARGPYVPTPHLLVIPGPYTVSDWHRATPVRITPLVSWLSLTSAYSH